MSVETGGSMNPDDDPSMKVGEVAEKKVEGGKDEPAEKPATDTDVIPPNAELEVPDISSSMMSSGMSEGDVASTGGSASPERSGGGSLRSGDEAPTDEFVQGIVDTAKAGREVVTSLGGQMEKEAGLDVLNEPEKIIKI